MTVVPTDWEALRALGHQLIDLVIDRQRTMTDRKVFTPPSGKTKAAMQRPCPIDGIGFDGAIQKYLGWIEPHVANTTHPDFLGWASGGGTTFGAFTQLLTAALNTNAFGGEQASTYAELELLSWLKTILRLPSGSNGLLTSGASMANLLALHCARGDVVVTDRAHASIARAARLLGVEVHRYPHVPPGATCLVGTAGDVMDGTFDDLDDLGDVAEQHRLSFHVDAAIGIGAALSPKLQDRLRGIERADSVAFDLHKWLQIGTGVGGLLVRDPERLERAMKVEAPYLGPVRGGIGGTKFFFSELGIEHTRRFRALEPWMVFSAYGFAKLGAVVERCVEEAQTLADAIDRHGDFTLLSSALNIVLFSFDETKDRRLIAELQQRGVVVFSPGQLDGRFCLRAAFFGHQATAPNLDAIAEVARLL